MGRGSGGRRSSGGRSGGSRSFGGRSGGIRSGRGNRSRSGGGFGAPHIGGGFGGFRPGGVHIHLGNTGRRYSTPNMQGMSTNHTGSGSTSSSGNPSGKFDWVSLIVTIAVILVFISILSASCTSGGNASVTRSTVNREPLSSDQTVESEYYRDDLGWIKNETRLTSGMKAFYKETGVAPFLYITDNINGDHFPSASAVEDELNEMYDELFEDDGHFILLFLEYDGYETWYLCGSAAETVMDDEACEILLDYIDRYYDTNFGIYNDEEYFSTVFEKASERIMTKQTSPATFGTVAVVCIAVIVVIVLFIQFSKKRAEAKKAEDERMKQILETPLETFGDQSLDELAKKYMTSEEIQKETQKENL